MQLPEEDVYCLKARDPSSQHRHPLTVTAAPRRVLTERNMVRRITTKWMTPSHLTLSAKRRHEVLQSRISQEKLRRRKMVKRIEYQRLRTMVPSIAKKPKVSKVTVIEEAIRYIDYLHEALLLRLRTKGLPMCLRDANVDVNQMSHEDVKNLVCRMVETNNEKQSTSSSTFLRRPSGCTNGGQRRQRVRQTSSSFSARSCPPKT